MQQGAAQRHTASEWTAPALAAGMVVLWVVWNSLWDGALYGDNVEQFIWAHSMEWGYHKHPPLPTWLLGLAIFSIGSHWWLANALAAACLCVTGGFTWLIARRLLGVQLANVALLLWGLQQAFSVSAHIYNHNTVLVACIAATAWCVLSALDARGRAQWPWWLAAGAMAGASMLAKYQAMMPLLGIVVAAVLVHRPSVRRPVAGLALAATVALLVFMPHLAWLIRFDFPTLRYASEAVQAAGASQRLAFVATFVVNQIRLLLPLLLTLGVCWGMARLAKTPDDPVLPSARYPGTALWLNGLLWGPLCLVVLLALASGSVLRNHWGVQLFQFIALWVAWRWQGNDTLRWPRLWVVAACVQVLGLGYYALKQSDPLAVQAERRADSAYPARQMTQVALELWRQTTRCPLLYVVGDFEAGLVSVYSGLSPAVFISAQATPWIRAKALDQAGALVISERSSGAYPGAATALRWPLDSTRPEGRAITMAVLPPRVACP